MLLGNGHFGPIACERVKNAVEVFHRVANVPLSFSEKALIGSRGPMMAALHGCEVTAFTVKTLQGLKAGAEVAVWGRGRKMRSSAIVCHVLSPAGIDPHSAIAQRRMGTFLRMMTQEELQREAEEVWRLVRDRKTEVLRQRVDRIAELARLRQQNPGVENPRVPVKKLKKGVIELLWDDLERYGWKWDDFHCWTTHTGMRVSIQQYESGKWLHELRVGIRAKAFRATAERRTGMKGIESGVDRQLTNELWRDASTDRYVAGTIRGTLSGSTVVGVHLQEWGKDVSSLCRYCDMAIETRVHTWWWCPRWDSHRGEDIDELRITLMNAPPCFMNHGLVPEVFLQELSAKEKAKLVKRVQGMMAAIIIARHAYDREIGRCDKKNAPKLGGMSMFPWGWKPPQEAELEAFDPLERVLWKSGHIHSDKWTEDLFWAMKTWLAALRWPDGTTPPITQIELMLDFEVFSGLDVPGVSVGKRAEFFGSMLRQAEVMAGGRTVWKGVRLTSVRHLGELGAGTHVGYSVRPVLTYSAEVEQYLRDMRLKATEKQAATVAQQKKKKKGTGWGDCTVTHSAADERSVRGEQWKQMAEAQVQAETRRRESAIAAVAAAQRIRADERRRQTPAVRVKAQRKQGNMQVCVTHSRLRCEDCTLNRNNINNCCAMHHCDANILEACDEALDSCEQHSMSACGQCAGAATPMTAKQCCGKHHNCRGHDRGACDICVASERKKKNRDGRPMIASPANCCKKGHHDVNQTRLVFR